MLTTIVLIGILIVLVLLRLTRWGAAVRTREEVAQYIENFIDGRGGEWDWDDFTSVAIKDPYLDRIRRQCLDAERNIAALRALRDDLRGRAA